jgi:glucose/arabinose dehydrogenase
MSSKPGRLRIFADGTLSPPVQNVPTVAYLATPSEQGGLLDVAVDPGFTQNATIYLSYSEEAAQPASQPDPGDPRFGEFKSQDTRVMRGAVARARLDGSALSDVQVIWRQEPKTVGRGHFGHRIVFGRDGTLFITSGERMRFDPAQSRTSNLEGEMTGVHVRTGALRRRAVPVARPPAGRRPVVDGARPPHD